MVDVPSAEELRSGCSSWTRHVLTFGAVKDAWSRGYCLGSSLGLAEQRCSPWKVHQAAGLGLVAWSLAGRWCSRLKAFSWHVPLTGENTLKRL